MFRFALVLALASLFASTSQAADKADVEKVARLLTERVRPQGVLMRESINDGGAPSHALVITVEGHTYRIQHFTHKVGARGVQLPKEKQQLEIQIWYGETRYPGTYLTLLVDTGLDGRLDSYLKLMKDPDTGAILAVDDGLPSDHKQSTYDWAIRTLVEFADKK